MPSTKIAPAPGDAAASNPKMTKLWQSLEPLMTEALSACVLEEPDDPLGFVIDRLSAAHQRGQTVAPAATKPKVTKDTPAQTKLRAQVEAALKPLQQAQQTEAASKKHALPEAQQTHEVLYDPHTQYALISQMEEGRLLRCRIDPQTGEMANPIESVVLGVGEQPPGRRVGS